VHRPSRLCISRQTNKARTLTSSLFHTLIKSSWLNSDSELAFWHSILKLFNSPLKAGESWGFNSVLWQKPFEYYLFLFGLLFSHFLRKSCDFFVTWSKESKLDWLIYSKNFLNYFLSYELINVEVTNMQMVFWISV